jgi:flagellar protein FlgJ
MDIGSIGGKLLDQAAGKAMNGLVNKLQNDFLHPTGRDKQKLKETAQQFEGIFIKQLLDAMDKTIDRSGMLSGGHAEEMFRGMMNDEVSKKMAERNGLGLAQSIYRQVSQIMDHSVQPGTPATSRVNTAG